MIKMQVSYEDFDGNPVTEELYFHLGKGKLIQLLAEDDQLGEKLQAVGSSANGAEIMKTFRQIVAWSYGVRTDAKTFQQSDDLSEEFLNSPAFDQLLTDLLSSPDKAATFVNGLFPSDLAKQVAEASNEQPRTLKAVTPVELVIDGFTEDQSGLSRPRDGSNNFLPWAFRKPTDSELKSMTKIQLLDVMRRQGSDWTPPETANPV